MIRSIVARIDLDALRHNFATVRRHLRRACGSRAPAIIAVVKANAYGHGAPGVARALEQAGARMFACADIEEGAELRRAGIRAPILVLGGLSVGEVDDLVDLALTPVVSSPAAARLVHAAAVRRGTIIGYHLDIDTGINRLGFRHDNLERTLPALLGCSHLRLEAVSTHFASADARDGDVFDIQRRRFDRACGLVDRAARDAAAKAADGRRARVWRHACNSAALLRAADAWHDAVRPGLLLYGIVPPPLTTTLSLQPVLSLTSRIAAIKRVRRGEGVGYGWRFRADSPRSIAIVPGGYADGIDRRLGDCGSVLVRGRRAPIVGAVSMDMMTVDVTDIESVALGEEVVILGRQGRQRTQRIDACEIAATIGTIPWEIVSRLGSRIERVYVAARGAHRTIVAASPAPTDFSVNRVLPGPQPTDHTTHRPDA